MSGEGEAGYQGGEKGDLYVEISIDRHDLFERDGATSTARSQSRLPWRRWEDCKGHDHQRETRPDDSPNAKRGEAEDEGMGVPTQRRGRET